MTPIDMSMSTYYHEAAHAVFAWSVSMTINTVQVRVDDRTYEGDDDSEGYVSVMLPVVSSANRFQLYPVVALNVEVSSAAKPSCVERIFKAPNSVDEP